MTALVLQAKNVCFKYKGNDFPALDDISFEIKPGCCTGIIGPNGAGKSTLISVLCGLLVPETGHVTYKNSQQSSLSKTVQQHVALIPQEYAFYPELSVLQNLAYFVALSEKKRRRRQALITKSLQQCGLQNVANKKASSLSGGYKRRLNIAIALSKEPDIIFLDEPTVGIDPISRKEIITLLSSLKAQGKTLIYTSHMLNEVEQICDDIILLEQGKTLAVSSTDNENMYLNIELIPDKLSSEVLTKLDLTEISDRCYEIKINNSQHLADLLRIFSENSTAIKNLQFSNNSIDHLYFNRYKAQVC